MVTGGAGFIGSHITDLLIADGYKVIVVDNLSTGKRQNLNPKALFYHVDIRSDDLARVIRETRPDVVFHQAAQSAVKVSTDDPKHDADVNVVGLINLLEACSSYDVRKVVFASSGATYGNPHYLPMDEEHPQHPESPYGISKMVSEHYLRYYARDKNLSFTALRYGNVYGPRQDPYGEAGVVAIFTQQLLLGEIPTIHWDGKQSRDYVYVTDVARANLLAANAGDNACYCIGTGRGTSVNRIFSMIQDALGRTVIPRHSDRRPGDLRHAHFDSTRARVELGWSPTVRLPAGIAETVEAFREAFVTEELVASAG
jgi:UDP-glucose 4-epimerase